MGNTLSERKGEASAADMSSPLPNAARLVSFAVVCGALYWGQAIFVPLALAGLVTFLLNPLVTRSRRWGLPRGVAVFLVIGVVTGLLVGLGWIMANELRGLAADLPGYRENVRDKIADVRSMMRSGTLERVQATIADLSQDIEQDASREQPADESSEDSDPVPVEIRAERSFFSDAGALAPVLEPVGIGALALLLSIFMLIKQTDIRNRLVSLGGTASLATTTHALAEAGQRISRYLVMQFLVNATMGLAVWVGLSLIGVPYSALWGLAAGVLRYIPYVGPWIAALLPLAVSLITAPGWTQVALVAGLFVTLELLSNNVMEPLLYGNSSGLSAIAVIVAAAFWTLMWGPVGLILATPLTACLVVLARYVPALEVFGRLLGDGQALEPHEALYQRLLARDREGAQEIVQQYRQDHSIEEVCQDLLLGVVLALKRDLAEDHVALDEGDWVMDALLALIGEVEKTVPDTDSSPKGQAAMFLMGFPSDDRLDEVALRVLRVLMRDKGDCRMEILSADTLIGERIATIVASSPSVVCVPSLPPADLARTRHVCKRIRDRASDVKIIVARFGTTSRAERAERLLRSEAAHQVTHTLVEFRDATARLVRNGWSTTRLETLGKA